MQRSSKYRFNVEFLEEAAVFLSDLDIKTREKVLENIRISRFKNDPKLLKKIDQDIWEFRSRHNKLQIRLFAFWDKEIKSLIVCTHGFIKKLRNLRQKRSCEQNEFALNIFNLKTLKNENL